MFFGGFLALLYVATNRLSFVIVGLAMFGARRLVLRRARWATCRTASTPGGTRSTRSSTTCRAAPTRSRSRSSRRPTAGCSAPASARRRSTCPSGESILPAPHTDLIYAVITNELGLAGACGLLLVYLLFIERGFATAMLRAGLLLQAARHRADGGLRAAGVRDRRRRHEGDPAHRRDAAVRVLRRLLDPGQLHPAGPAAARLRPGAEARRARGEPRPSCGSSGSSSCCSRCSSASPRAGRSSRPRQLRDNPENARALLQEQRIRRGTIRSADGARARALRARRQGETFRRRYPTDDAVRPRRRLLLHRPRPRGDRALAQRRAHRPAHGARHGVRVDPRAQPGAATTCARRSTRGAQRTAIEALGGRKGAVVALDVHTGAVRVLASRPPTTRTGSQRGLPRARDATTRTRRCVNRATQNGYPPGSTFKVVTAAAALDSGELPARLGGRRQQREGDLGRPAEQLRRTELRADRPDHRADELRQHGLGRGRGARSAAGRCRSTWSASGSTPTRRWTTPTTR